MIGTPGGDAGEFLLVLAALEQATGTVLDEETVLRTLLANLDNFGVFYMHTDGHAFDTLTESLRADSRLERVVAPITEPEDWAQFFHDPGEGSQDASRAPDESCARGLWAPAPDARAQRQIRHPA